MGEGTRFQRAIGEGFGPSAGETLLADDEVRIYMRIRARVY